MTDETVVAPARERAGDSATRRRIGYSLIGGNWLYVYAICYVIFTLAPLLVVVGASFEPRELLRFPPHGFSFRWYLDAWNSPLFVGAARNSLLIALMATAGALLLGVPAAYALVRNSFRGRTAVSGLLSAPLLVPELVMGLALLQVLASLGIATSLMSLTVGHILICMPYVIRTVAAAIEGIDPAIEEAARNLGARRLAIYTTIVLPIIAPALFVAMLFAFLMSFDNAVISLFLVSARTTTLPIQIYNYVEYSLDPSVAAISTVLMAISLAVLLIVSKLVPLERLK